MILNETTLGELCARVADGDKDARRDFDRHVLPVVEAIVGRWLSHERPEGAESGARPEISRAADSTAERRRASLLPSVAEAVCAQMIAQAAGPRRTRGSRRRTSAGPRLACGETISALIERHTVSRLVPWPA
ncbi:MAG TPA: hypothetical protein VG125_17410 [Pirellulales bacterium]|jgi:hypothetical protein|nr:hypothetical protein [Pirellulales bacterium]